MIKKASFIFLLGLICSCSCDVSAISSSGWHPSPASLALPGEYGAPPLPTATSVQVSEENIQFAGQTVEVNQPAAQRPSNTYLPATSARIQSKPTKFAQPLPKKQPAKPFNTQLNTGEVFAQRGQLNRPVFLDSSRLQAQNPFQYHQQLPQFQQIKQFNPQPQFQQQQAADPSVYGPPAQSGYPYPAAPTTPAPVHETVEETEPESAQPEDDNDGPVIAVANANGQYYILGKDNTLQRVVYETTQTEDDILNNGFTAQLRYTPVEPIVDPVYGYDDQGHLIRIYNKK